MGHLGLRASSVKVGTEIALRRPRVDAAMLLQGVDRLPLPDHHHLVEGLDHLPATLHRAEVVLLRSQRVRLRAHDSARQDVVADLIVARSVEVAEDQRDGGLVLVVVAQGRRVRDR